MDLNIKSDLLKIEDAKKIEDMSKKEIKVGNYRTVPCKNYHGP